MSCLATPALKFETCHDHSVSEDGEFEGTPEDAMGESGSAPSSNVNYAKSEDHEYTPLRSPIERGMLFTLSLQFLTWM